MFLYTSQWHMQWKPQNMQNEVKEKKTSQKDPGRCYITQMSALPKRIHGFNKHPTNILMAFLGAGYLLTLIRVTRIKNKTKAKQNRNWQVLEKIQKLEHVGAWEGSGCGCWAEQLKISPCFSQHFGTQPEELNGASHIHVHRSTHQNCQKVEATHVSINRWLEGQ